MLFLAWLLILMMMMMKMKSDAASAETIRAQSGEAVLLDSNMTGPVNDKWDFRWTQLPSLMLTPKNNNRSCGGGRCELLANGSLRFSRVQTADAGNYSLQVFDEGGKLLRKKVILLEVESRDTRDDGGSSSSSSRVVVSVLTCCFHLILLFIIFFILRRRRSQKTRTTGANK